MATTTNNNSNNTVGNPAPSTTVNPASDQPKGTVALGSWAGSLWTILLQLEALSSNIESSMQTTLSNTLGMQFDEGMAAAKSQRDQAYDNANATRVEGITSLTSGALTIGMTGLTAMASKPEAKMAQDAQNELDRLNKINTDHFLRPQNPDLIAGQGAPAAGARSANVKARITELATNGPDAFKSTQAKRNNNPFAAPMTKQEMIDFDENPNPANTVRTERSVYDQLGVDENGVDERAAVKANLDKAIDKEHRNLEIYSKRVSDGLNRFQMYNQVAGALCSGAGAMKKQEFQRDGGDDAQKAQVAQTEQQMAQQSVSTLKSFIDKAADSGVSVVQQITNAISTSMRA